MVSPAAPASPTALPRVVVAAPATGAGKTTLTTGLMAALRRRGLEVSGHKVGPDYIDPGYHALACGRPGRNLDPHLVGEHRVAPLLLHGARTPVPADVAVIEGVMGLFDGRIGGRGFSSTAHVATLVDAPVLLVVDVARSSRTLGAVVHGLATFDPRVRVGGVVLNRAGSPRLVAEVTEAIADAGLPVLGSLPPDDAFAAPSRHLGLVPAAERGLGVEALDALADSVATHVDLDAVLALAASAPPLTATPWDPAAEVVAVPGRPRVALAGGRAFTFRYAETEELLRAAGCEPVELDPLHDERLPEGTTALHLGGGFPEVHAAELSANAPLRAAVRDAVAAGMPVVAECAGLLYLAGTLDDVAMTGALPVSARMAERLTLRYPRARAAADSLLTRVGEEVTGHEFHRTVTEPAAGTGAWAPAWEIDGAATGFASPSLHASYLHLHPAGTPEHVQRLAEAAAAWSASC